MPPKAANKRQHEDVDDAPPAKRGRGRPPKDPNATAPPPKDPDAPKRGRGRPPKDPNAALLPEKSPKTVNRGRGRPKKTSDATPTAPTTASRGRGRPRKDAATIAPATPKTSNTKTKTASRGRGRPKKDSANIAPVTPEPGSTKKDAAKATPSLTRQTPKGSNKAGLKLTDLIGSYDVRCEEVEGSWPDVAEDMYISIAAVPETNSVLIAKFDMGIIEGTMLLAADEDTLERVRRQMEGNGSIKVNKTALPTLVEREVYFAWRGRNTGDSEVHPGSGGTQTGSLKFHDDACSSFEGVGSFPAMGKECPFIGSRFSDDAEEDVEPWDNFSEEAYEEANRRRWG